MIEIPEGIVLARQIDNELKHKRIREIVADSSHHKFAWYQGDPTEYRTLFKGKIVEGAYSYGGKLHIKLSQNCGFMFCDGTSPRYYTDIAKIPSKHQLYMEFDDATCLICTIRMYGGIYGYTGELDNTYDSVAQIKPSVMSDDFDIRYFAELLSIATKPKLSVKAFLATEQRVPGLGNGVLQDILFNSAINPKTDVATLDSERFERLFRCVKDTILEMTQNGGRDTETDLYGNHGGYKTILSKNTYGQPCPRCGGRIQKEAYLGGSVYYCTECQS